MSWLKTIFREIFGLFVDDGSFAIAILIWLGLMWFLLLHFGHHQRWSGPILFAGLALILVESLIRYARRKQSRPTR